MNIYEKLLSITNEIKNVNKNLEVGIGKNSYKAVGEADVLAAVKTLEEKYKVYSYPVDRQLVAQEILQTEKEYNGSVTKGNQIFLRIETTYRFVNTEKPEEYIDIKSYGDGIDTQDKAPGKAMTYSDKYALLKAYKIITGDDPDQSASPDKASYKKKAANPKKDEAPKTATPEQLAIIDKVYKDVNLLRLLNENNIVKLSELPYNKATEIIKALKDKQAKKKARERDKE